MGTLGTFQRDSVVAGDCLNVMEQMPNKCMDLVVTSPPYWDLKDYGAVAQIGYGQSLEEYINGIARVVTECYRLAPWVIVNIGDKETEPSASLHALLISENAAPLWQTIIWWKRNNTPYNIPKKLHLKHEYCLVFGPGETFNEEAVLQPYSQASLKDKRPYTGHRSGANPGTVWDIPAFYGKKGAWSELP